MVLRPRHTLPLVILLALALPPALQAFYVALTLEEKVAKADVIFIGKVIRVTKVITPAESDGEDDGFTFWSGPTEMAVIKVETYVSRPHGDIDRRQLVEGDHILVPCGYTFDDSPSSLTDGRRYVVFLKELGAGIYHPLDPSCTYPIYDNRVLKSGENGRAPKDAAEVAERTLPLDQFLKQIRALLGGK